MSSYAAIVADNLRQMGSSLSEWKPVKVKAMAETVDDKGNPVLMPEFDFPQGYGKAPSRFAKEDNCCQLCGHDIKNVWWIQNDTKRWTMAVGCECVKLDGEVDGLKAAKKDIAADNRAFIAELEALRAEYYHDHTAPIEYRINGQVTYGHAREWLPKFNKWSEERKRYVALKELLGDLTAKLSHYDNLPIWSDRQIANWLKKNRAAAESLAKSMRQTTLAA